MRTLAEFFDNKRGRRCAIHEDAHFGPLDNDTGVKPLIAIGFGDHRPFILAGVFRPENMPRPLRMRDVLDCMAVALRVGCAKVEWPEVNRVVRCLIHHTERDANKTSLHRLASPKDVYVDDSFCEVIAIKPHQAHAGALAELHRAFSLDVHNRCRAVGNLPPRISTDSSQVHRFRCLGARCTRDAREGRDETQSAESVSIHKLNFSRLGRPARDQFLNEPQPKRFSRESPGTLLSPLAFMCASTRRAGAR